MSADKVGLLAGIVSFSLRFRGVVIALAVVALMYGLYSLTRARFDVFPEFTSPQVTVLLEAPGFSPEQVEVLITTPVENAVSGVEGIEAVRSRSFQGLSAITIVFRAGSDIYLARQLVAERLSSLTEPLPQGVTPFITPLTSSTSTVLQMGLGSKNRSLMEIRTIADFVVKPRLLAIPGVAQVQVYGGEVRQIQIQLLPERLIQYNLSVQDVLATARKATAVQGAGFIETQNQRIVLRTEGQSLKPREVAGTLLVRQDGANVTLGDVAKVVDGPAPPIGAASINGQPGVVFIVSSQYGANTLQVTRSLDQALDELRPTLEKEGVTLYPDLFRPATFIRTAIHNVMRAIEMGAVLVVAVLFLFLFNFRTAAISFTAIPLSLVSAILLLEYFGYSLDTMTLGGLAVAIGEVVDDAVIDVENIFRRLREHRRPRTRGAMMRTVLRASVEIRSAVVFATFSVVLVFVPVLTLSGVAGRLFAPLGVAYIFAVLASLVVALTVTPALCFLLLSRHDLPRKEPPVVRWSKDQYRKALLLVQGHPRAVMGGVALLIAAGAFSLRFLSGGFLPELRESDFIAHVTMIPGTSLQESLRLGDQVSKEFLKLPYVSSVSQKTGRAEEGSSTRGIGSSEIDVNLKPMKPGQPEYHPSQIRELLSKIPGIDYAVHTFLTERIAETISGYTAPVIVNIFGNDLDVLDRKGQEVLRVLMKIKGAAGVVMQSRPESPHFLVKLKRERLAQWGFDPVDVLDTVKTMYQGTIVGQTYEGNRVFDVSVVLDHQERKQISSLGRLPLRTLTGAYIPLRLIADIHETSGRSVILHDGGRRVQTVTCNVAGVPVNSFTDEAKKEIRSQVSLPPGTYLEFTGTAEAEAKSRQELMVHAAMAGFGIVLLLTIVLGSLRNVLLVLLNLPFALVGGVMIILATEEVLSLGSWVGFVTVFGITLRNSIMMISHYQHLVATEGVVWGPEAALKGASERLAPILMTALVTGLGILPLALGASAAGREIEGSMAIVILGGLVTSTVLNLLVLPPLALKCGRFEKGITESNR